MNDGLRHCGAFDGWPAGDRRSGPRAGDLPRSIAARIALVAVLGLSFGHWGVGIAEAGARPGLTGVYVCRSGCRLTDAAPTIAVEGEVAHCMNELGGTYDGKVLADDEVYCFNKTGVLSADGRTILWSNGAVWERR